MKSVQKLQFSTVINAPAASIWRHITTLESYMRWTSAFAEGSHFVGTWNQGSRILFLSPTGDGMVAEIAEYRENEFISIRHLGFTSNGIEDTTSEAIKTWAPAYENYTLMAVPDGIKLVVNQDVAAEWADYMNEAWPKALVLLKEISEARTGVA
jgi:hypothetical protein